MRVQSLQDSSANITWIQRGNRTVYSILELVTNNPIISFCTITIVMAVDLDLWIKSFVEFIGFVLFVPGHLIVSLVLQTVHRCFGFLFLVPGHSIVSLVFQTMHGCIDHLTTCCCELTTAAYSILILFYLKRYWRGTKQEDNSNNTNSRRQSMCCVCLVEEANIAFLPCGHRCCCDRCAVMVLCRKKRWCPICSLFAKSSVEIFDS